VSGELKLHGHSNYKLSTYTFENNVYVKKTSISREESERLKIQRDKQNGFLKFVRDDEVLSCIFDVPRVVGESTHDDRFSFYMEYRNGFNIIEYFSHNGRSHYVKLFNDLFKLIEKETSKCKVTTLDTNLLKDKLDDIKSKVKDREIKRYLKNFKSWVLQTEVKVPTGFCHGDLTFSNMMMSDKILLIDFLDDFVDSPIQDICKLLQSVNLQWELLITKNLKLDKMKINIAYRFLRNELKKGIEQYMDKHDINEETLLILYTLTILRITPYVKNDMVMDRLKLELKRLEEKKCIHI